MPASRSVATAKRSPPVAAIRPRSSSSRSASSHSRERRTHDPPVGRGHRRDRANAPGHVGSIHALAFGPGDTQLWPPPVPTAACGSGTSKPGEVIFTMTEAYEPAARPGIQPRWSQARRPGGVDKTISFWDVTTGRLVHTLEGHTNWVMGVAFSPDGSRLASAGADQTVRIWDVARGRELLSLRGPEDRVHGVAFSPDGLSLAAASADGQVWVWQGTPVPPAVLRGESPPAQTSPAIDTRPRPISSISKKTGLAPPLLVHYQRNNRTNGLDQNMSGATKRAFFEPLERLLFDAGTCAGLSDGQLLARFLAGRDQAGELAFEKAW